MRKRCCEESRQHARSELHLPAFVDQLDERETCILLDGVLPFLQVNTDNISNYPEITFNTLRRANTFLYTFKSKNPKKTTRAKVKAASPLEAT